MESPRPSVLLSQLLALPSAVMGGIINNEYAYITLLCIVNMEGPGSSKITSEIEMKKINSLAVSTLILTICHEMVSLVSANTAIGNLM